MKMILSTLGLTALACALVFLTGCVKHIETPGGTKIDFITGWDVGASFNGVDRVDNERGIAPHSTSK